MRDRYQTNDLGIRAIAECERVVRSGADVMIEGEWFRGRCLIGLAGKVVHLKVVDAWALEYKVWLDGREIGSVKYVRKVK